MAAFGAIAGCSDGLSAESTAGVQQGVVPFVQTRKVCQLSGELDKGAPSIPTGLVRGGGARNATGTDIGWSFEHNGALQFAFGDTRNFPADRCQPYACGVDQSTTGAGWDGPRLAIPSPVQRWQSWPTYVETMDAAGFAPESWATASLTSNPGQCLALGVAAAPDGSFRQTRLEGKILGVQEGVFSAVSRGTDIIGFATRRGWPICGTGINNCCEDPWGQPGWPGPRGCSHDAHLPGGRTSLVLSRDGGANFQDIVHFSGGSSDPSQSGHFQFVAPSIKTVPPTSGAGSYPLSFRGQSVIHAFGSGQSRYDSPDPASAEEPALHKWVWGSFPYLAINTAAGATQKTGAVYSHTIALPDLTFPAFPAFGTVNDAYQLGGPAIGLQAEDKWIVSKDDRVYVVRSDGYVWYHTVSSTTVGVPQHLPPREGASGTLVATNPQDRWVLMDSARSRLLVITVDGRVFYHRLTDRVEPALELWRDGGVPVAAQPQDQWVFVIENQLVVVTKSGDVFGHALSPTNIGGQTYLGAFYLDDPTIGSYQARVTDPIPPADFDGDGYPDQRGLFPRSVVAVDDRLVLIDGAGRVASYQVQGSSLTRDVGWIQSGDDALVARRAEDRWVLPIHPPGEPWQLLVIPYWPTGWRYFAGLTPLGAAAWTTNATAAAPLAGFAAPHDCLGYYSVRYIEAADRWVMLYSCGDRDPSGAYVRDRAIYLRTAPGNKPWGPWSAPMKVWYPSQGYCEYMHLPVLPAGKYAECPSSSPNPSEDEKRENNNGGGAIREPGGEYAPFLLPSRFAQPLNGSTTDFTLYYTLSTWNPYQTVLMETTLTLP